MATNITRILLLIEGLLFLAAASVHFGISATGYEHSKAGTAESVIGIVLLAGLAASLLVRSWTRAAALIVQAFALLGTCVGLFMIAIGVGPGTAPDLGFHAVIILLLIWGLIRTWRLAPAEDEESSLPSSSVRAH